MIGHEWLQQHVVARSKAPHSALKAQGVFSWMCNS
jgi:hypothetical protein